jgi:hypothetical protein
LSQSAPSGAFDSNSAIAAKAVYVTQELEVLSQALATTITKRKTAIPQGPNVLVGFN